MLGNFDKKEANIETDDIDTDISSEINNSDEIENENMELNKKYKELYENYLRSLADFENFKKRTRKESLNNYRSGQTEILKDILDISDDFDRGREFLINCKNENEFLTGLELIANKFKNLLVSHNTLCYGECGEDFDPKIHEAVASECVNDPEMDCKIIRIIRKGFIKEDEVLRPAQVIVGRYDNDSEEKPENTADKNE